MFFQEDDKQLENQEVMRAATEIVRDKSLIDKAAHYLKSTGNCQFKLAIKENSLQLLLAFVNRTFAQK